MIHPNYNPSTFENDIGLIFCDAHFPIANRIPIGDSASVPNNFLVKMTGVGYGITSSNANEISRIPYYANLTSYVKDRCKITAPTQFCAYTTKGETGAFCLGDEGSGLTSNSVVWNQLKTTTLVYYIYSFVDKYSYNQNYYSIYRLV